VADTNDIGFVAVRVGEGVVDAEGEPVAPGVYFRVLLGGITGHKDFARDAGLLLEPRQCLPVAVAAIRAFIEHGDRTDRKKARLKYVLDRMGHDAFLAETVKHLPAGVTVRRVSLEHCELPAPPDRFAHVGVHRQKQPGLNYVGVVLRVGRMTAAQMRGLADVAARHGGSSIRLTVWQNLLLTDVPDGEVESVKRGLERLGLGWSGTAVRAGLVACTGNAGCKFSSTDTKRHAADIAAYLDAAGVRLDTPVNIHLTGCPHSCAQHYIGDVGLLGTKVSVGDDMVEGYHVYVGGGYGPGQGIGRELLRDVAAADVGPLLERLFRGYQERRNGRDGGPAPESLLEFTRRQSVEELRDLLQPEPAAAT
jgi:ferredoxin-nitrite reductase